MERFTNQDGSPKPLDHLEQLGLWTYTLFWADKSNLPKSLIDIKRLRNLAKIVAAISSGERSSISLAEFRQELFPDYQIVAKGTKNLPASGPFAIASDHYMFGPFNGMWQIPAISEVFDRAGHKSPQYIIDSTKPSIQKIPDISPRTFIREKLTGYLRNLESTIAKIENTTVRDALEAALYELIFNLVVTSDFTTDANPRQIVKHQVEHGLFNLASATNFIPTQTSARQIIESLRKGEILGIFPTAKPEYKLHRALPEAGKFFRLVNRYNAPVVPIGAWHNETEKTFRINIGKPILLSQGLSNQEAADTVMEKVAHELPEEMWGEYSGSRP